VAWLWLALGSAWILAGCRGGESGPVIIPSEDGGSSEEAGEEKRDILNQVIQLVETAATNPGGQNFTMAAESLNDLFNDAPDADFRLPSHVRSFLETQSLPPDALAKVENPRFDGQVDGRHIEDCMLYRDVARAILGRKGGDADKLTQARAIFDWVTRQVQLVPPGSLAPPGMVGADGQPFQALVRPYDALLRGLATDIGSGWAERSWLFLALCRQAGIEGGYLVVMPASAESSPATADAAGGEPKKDDAPPSPESMAKSLGCGLLIDGEIYLFDARLGLPIPGPGGVGVATLDQAASDPRILEQLDLPDRPYRVHQPDLAGGKIRVLLEATLGSLSPRMKMLQRRLTAEKRMVLYRDPTEQVGPFSDAVGPRLEAVQLWGLPLEVEFRLFRDPAFNQATGYSIYMFDPQLPLLQARLEHLRGEVDQAIGRYASFRFATGLVMADGKTPIPPEAQQILDLYATHFLALAQLDKGRDDQAEFLFGQTLKLFPGPAPNQPFEFMFRWGAEHNLGLLHEAEGQAALAARYYGLEVPTDQSTGDRLRAQALIWADPFVPEEELPVPSAGPDRLPPVRSRPAPRQGPPPQPVVGGQP
jgi:hypothetical protein